MNDIAGPLPSPADLVAIMRQDKKAQGGKLTFILARAIGDTFIAKNVPDSAVTDFLAEDFKRK
jgi:3-dehydroquinate synthase